MSDLEVKETRRRELLLTVTVPDAERVERRQPYSSTRRYLLSEVRVRVVHDSGDPESVAITLYGPLITKAGTSSKVRCDEHLWNASLDTLGPATRQAIEQRLTTWRGESA